MSLSPAGAEVQSSRGAGRGVAVGVGLPVDGAIGLLADELVLERGVGREGYRRRPGGVAGR